LVGRAKRGLDARRVGSNPVDRRTGLIGDQLAMLAGSYPVRNDPEPLRRIKVNDPASGQTLVLPTDNSAWPALTSCALNKSRWQLALLSTWIRQPQRTMHFLGKRENAVTTQVRCAVAPYLLMAIVRRELQIDASMYT